MGDGGWVKGGKGEENRGHLYSVNNKKNTNAYFTYLNITQSLFLPQIRNICGKNSTV